jgi:hypothetical protein
VPYLANEKYELYCREWVNLRLSGEDEKAAREKAYVTAGFGARGKSSIASNARKFHNSAPIKRRCGELFREECSYRDITKAKLVLRVDRVGTANMRDYYDRDGKLIPVHKLRRDLAEAICEVKYDADGRVTYKLHDKNQANFTLLKLFGDVPDEDEAAKGASTTNIFNAFSPEAQKVLLGVLRAAAGSGRGAAEPAAGDHGGADPSA